MARDTQRKRLYRAEAMAPKGQIFDSLDEVIAYASTVISSDWWALNSRHTGKVKIVERDTLRGRAYYVNGLIVLPRFAWYERYTLHELTHIAHGLPQWHTAHHGAGYVALYHSMLNRFMGMDAAAAFRRGCLREGIAASLPVGHSDLLTAANRWYEASYRRYRAGLRSSPPSLRKGMTAQQARAIRSRVDLERKPDGVH